MLKLSSRVDSVASRVQTAVTMKSVSNSMKNVVNGMDKAMNTMNLDLISNVMDKFESQFNDLDLQTQYVQGTIQNSSQPNSSSPEQVDQLLQQVADENGLEISQRITDQSVENVPKLESQTNNNLNKDEDALVKRLKALRPAT